MLYDGRLCRQRERDIAEVQKHPNARVFSFGIGSSVNRFLLDKMAEAGRGEVEYVSLEDNGSKAAKKFHERVRTPLLTDLSIDWNGLPVADVYPGRLSDLFSAKPVILHGRYTKAASGTIKLKGKVAGQPYEREITVNLPESDPANDVLATLWARTRIDDLTAKGYTEAQPETSVKKTDETITNLGLEFRLMTQFTSFVAVEERVVNQNGKPVTVEVPVAVPEGVNPVGSGAEESDALVTVKQKGKQSISANGGTGGVSLSRLNKTGYYSTGAGQGTGSGSGSGNAPAATVVNVTSDTSAVAVDQGDIKIETNISRKVVEQIPAGTSFSSLLTLSPNVHPAPMNGGFQIDGSSGSENTFTIDGSEVTNFGPGY